MNGHAAKTLETRSMYHELKKKHQMSLYREYLEEAFDRFEFLDQYQLLGNDNINILETPLSDTTEQELTDDVHQIMRERDIDHVDVIVGGPPCQAYSVIGRSRDENRMEFDPRNYLYRHYINFLNEFKPEIFIFENVPGLKTAKNGSIYSNIQEEFKRIGYTVQAKTLNSADFGILQNRKRIIFIGWKEEHDLDYPEFQSIECKHTIWDLLADLPPLKPGEGMQGAGLDYLESVNPYLKKSGIRNENDILTHHIARPHIDRDREIYRIAINLWNNERRRLKYDELPDSLKTHKNQRSFLDRFKVVDGEGLSHSIVAHIAKDGHYFIHPDLAQARSISVREAARIQSFPDDFKFEGPRTAQFTQIGNAVPPLMAERIAGKISGMLKKINH